MTTVLATGMTLIWLYLLFGRGSFWRAAERDGAQTDGALPDTWPDIIAIVPARDEGDVIGRSMTSLLAQDYAGAFTVILVDDESGDDTAEKASAAALALGATERLTILRGLPRPPGWTGKLWSVKQGTAEALERSPLPSYLWLCDADVAFAPDTLRSMVARAEGSGLVLVSLMAKLRCVSFAERCLIPAFIFFFQMLYPFAWVNDPKRSIAGAAGGSMLVRSNAFQAAEGVELIRGALIDDCALARRLKDQGPIWLGLSDRAVSLRSYDTWAEIGRMVARSAYAQLRYSPILLAATVAGMALVFLAPPLLAIFATGTARVLGFCDWAAMALAYAPIARFYRQPVSWGAALPLIAAVYLVFTLDSAYQHTRGRGGLWKGRVQAISSGGK
jgi:hopene-associated glycosyltransferase HpnB